MRKSLILLLLLFVLSVGGVCYAHGMVNEAKDAVELTETVLMGEVSAAQGLSVSLRTNCQSHLFWDTTLEPGQLPATDFQFSQVKRSEEYGWEDTGVDLCLHTNVGFSGRIELEEDQNTYKMRELYGLSEPFQAVAGRTEPGTTHWEIININDYKQVYPLSVDLLLAGRFYLWQDAQWQAEENPEGRDPYSEDYSILTDLADYFQFPVLENHRLKITVTKAEDGTIVELDSSSVGDFDVWFETVNVITEDSCYFVVSAVTEQGETLLDYSRVPGGYGIYRLPCGTTEEPVPLKIEALQQVYPLAETERVALFLPNADKTKLLLVTEEEQTYTLKVLDAKTAQEVQRIPLMERREDRWLQRLYVGKDFLVALFSEGEFLLLAETRDGTYEVQYGGTLPEAVDFYESVMAFDGQKLAVAANDRYSKETSCGFSVAVCDQSGVLYAGRYDSSLDKGNPGSYRDRCRALEHDPLTLRWE